MTNEETKKRLGDIFSKYTNSNFNNILSRGWVFCENERKKDLLFVGINPSYPKNEIPQCYPYKIDDAIERYKRYYAVFKMLADGKPSEKNWAYMDLFYFRETKQAVIYEIMRKEGGKEFICDQLKLSYEIIQDISPKVIVVCNKGIHDFFGKNRTAKNKKVWMGFKFSNTEREDVKIIEGIESDFLNNDNFKLKGTKIVFSRHLSRTPKVLKDALKESIQYALQY